MEQATSLRDRLPLPRKGAGFKQLLAKLNYMPEQKRLAVVDAFQFGSSAHAGQKRASGEPYISHPVAVAGILAELHLDQQTICAAILHDVVEDTPTALQQIEQRFGQEVAVLVDGVSKLDQLNFSSRSEAQVESFRKMMLAMVEDIRVILVKLADRLHNMRTLDALPLEKQQRIASETLEIYAPIANRLGIHTLKTELEELGFRYAHPFRYRVISKTLKEAQGNQRQIVRRISERLRRAMRNADISGGVRGRKKNLYSIYNKMQRKRRGMKEVADVFGFRLIVEDVATCYQTLGVVHQVYKPMPGRFKDYIAIPRVNGYQSLHTTLLGPNGIPIEVQIRTTEMDKVAERGVAAHWQYKAADGTVVSPQARAREWLASISDIPSVADSEEFMEHVKVDLFPDKVYVFTPKGKILRLPRGATCVDFAYAVHTDVGNHCVTAKIDRRLVPLRTVLKNGQTVEIITAKQAHPNPTWVNFVATAKARHSIRLHLRTMRRNEAVELGRRLLIQALADYGTSLRRTSRRRIRALLDEFGLEKSVQLYEQIGLGERLAPLVAQMLVQSKEEQTESAAASAITIAGTEGMVLSYARCCHPLPGDEIMGYMSAGRGIVIHRTACGNLVEYSKQPNKWITVEWEPVIERDFAAEIRVLVDNKPGVLAEVATRIAEGGSNIDQVSVQEVEDNAELVFTILVKDRTNLARVIRSIRTMKLVIRVVRTCT
ncbi:MAG: RelA/SpoT family protein [Gammaproteobacteria bacterium]